MKQTIDQELLNNLLHLQSQLITLKTSIPKNNDSCTKLISKYEMELSRLQTLSAYENQAYLSGANLIAGIDEAGRGPLAGPVVTGCVVLPRNCLIEGVNDSKKVSAKKRDELFDIIIDNCISYSVGIVSVETIDEINILQATRQAMKKAIDELSVKPDFLLIDAEKIPDISIRSNSIIKGDALSISIAASSIIAKVTRDRMMDEYDTIYPQYGFSKHKGYGTAEHIKAIKQYGLCPIHRKTFTREIV